MKPNFTTLGRSGGLVRSKRKSEANRLKIEQFWAEVRSGTRPAPKHKQQKEQIA